MTRPYWIPMFDVPCCECGYPVAFVLVHARTRDIVHRLRQLPACSIGNPEHVYPLCPHGHLRSPDNVGAFGRCKACIVNLSHARSKGAAA